MEKSVIVSIRPYWIFKMSRGYKTLEIRKTKPNLSCPFKCYVYCVKGNPKDPHQILEIHDSSEHIHRGNGHIIAEFICDKMIPIHILDDGSIDCECPANIYDVLDGSCLGYYELADYIGRGNAGWGWHISEFTLYEQPKEITEFWEADRCPYVSEERCMYPYHCFRSGESKRCGSSLSKAPQSWRYTSGTIVPPFSNETGK